MRRLSACILLLLAMLIAGAQPFPGEPQPPNVYGMAGVIQPPMMQPAFQMFGGADTLIAVTPTGFFVLRSGTLTKYDPATLKLLGTLDLVAPPPPVPPGEVRADGGVGAVGNAPFAMLNQPAPNMPPGQGALGGWVQEMNRRAQPAVMLTTDNDILIVIGASFSRINQQTMKLEAKAALAANDAPNGMMMRQPMTAKLHGDQLYIVQGNDVVAVNVADGKTLGRATLPAPQNPPVIMGGVQVQPFQPQQPMVFGQPRNPPPGNMAVGPEGNGFGQPGAADPQAPPSNVVVGVIVKHDRLWTLKTDDDQVFIMEGAKSREMLALPNITTKRVRVMGVIDRNPGDNAFAQGYLDVLAYQVLTDIPNAR